MDQAGTELLRAVEGLADRLAGATPAWYAARPAGPRTRAEVLRELGRLLARLGADAGTGQPAGARPPVLGDHALADQLRVLAHELAIAAREARVAAALAAVRAVSGQL